MEDEFSSVLVKERPLNHAKIQNNVLIGEVSQEELRIQSKALLCCILYGNNSDGVDRLLRELYWYTIEALTHLESNR